MRKVAILLTAALALTLAGAFAYQADATTGAATLGLPSVAKNYSLVDQVACKFAGPTCPIGYTRVCRMWKCWCARCH
jgi:hypothetical protein